MMSYAIILCLHFLYTRKYLPRQTHVKLVNFQLQQAYKLQRPFSANLILFKGVKKSMALFLN